jgi:hypothetical protein
MSIVLKRPMFRRGGQVDLQSGIAVVKPRKGYAKGDLVGDTDTDPDLIAANIKSDDDAGLENYAIGDVMSNNKTGARDEDLYLQNADPDSVDDYITRALLSDTSLQSEPDLSKIQPTETSVTAANINNPVLENLKQKFLKSQETETEKPVVTSTPDTSTEGTAPGMRRGITPSTSTTDQTVVTPTGRTGAPRDVFQPMDAYDYAEKIGATKGASPRDTAKILGETSNQYQQYLADANKYRETDPYKIAALKAAEQKKQVTTTGTGGAGTAGVGGTTSVGGTSVGGIGNLGGVSKPKTTTAASTTAVNPYQTIIDTIKKSIIPTQEEQARNFYSNLFANMANVPLNQRTSLGQAVGAAAITNATRANELEKEAAKYGALGAIKELGNQKFGSPAEQGIYNAAYNITKLQDPNATEADAQLAGNRAVIAERQKTIVDPQKKIIQGSIAKYVSDNWGQTQYAPTVTKILLDKQDNPQKYPSNLDTSKGGGPFFDAQTLSPNVLTKQGNNYVFSDEKNLEKLGKKYHVNYSYINPQDGKFYLFDGKQFIPTKV